MDAYSEWTFKELAPVLTRPMQMVLRWLIVFADDDLTVPKEKIPLVFDLTRFTEKQAEYTFQPKIRLRPLIKAGVVTVINEYPESGFALDRIQINYPHERPKSRKPDPFTARAMNELKLKVAARILLLFLFDKADEAMTVTIPRNYDFQGEKISTKTYRTLSALRLFGYVEIKSRYKENGQIFLELALSLNPIKKEKRSRRPPVKGFDLPPPLKEQVEASILRRNCALQQERQRALDRQFEPDTFMRS